ncbi:LAFA_0F00826g1_1 [Lachancea sp. 'fantastica']|nr:LAFA_0F00826g1_1 [Lachancea sp. 'fantastica']
MDDKKIVEGESKHSSQQYHENDVGSAANELAVPDKLQSTRYLVIRKTEILAEQYNAWYYRIILLFCAFVCGYGYGLDGQLRYVYTTYAASSYGEHSLISTIGVINAIIGAAGQLLYARLSDTFGRLTLFLTAVVFYVVGTIIESQAYDIQRYAAGAVFYNLGYVGIILVLLLILSDFSSLKWRLLFQVVPTWPFIINTWISGNITEAANPTKNWSWDIGMWAFIFPLSCVPLVLCMLHMRYKARKTPEWIALKDKQTFFQSHGFSNLMIELFWKLDVVGILLLVVMLGCILAPLTLAGGVKSQWNNSHIIGPFVLGWVLIPILLYWEKVWARDPLVPYDLVKDRGVWSAMSVSFLNYFIFSLAAGYLYTILIVAVDESTKSATRISSLSSFVSVVWSPIFALFITRRKKLKPYIVMGCALWMLGMGLLYHYRGGSFAHGGIIGALVVWGIGSTMWTYPVNVSVQSATSHENMATVTGLNYTTYRIGGAVGSAVSGAIWTQLLYKKLLSLLGDAKVATEAYASPYTFILKYTWGTPQREAAVQAYRHVQKYETIVALVFTAPLLAFALCLRDPDLTDKVAHEDLEGNAQVAQNDSDLIIDWFKSKMGRAHKE